MPGREVVRGRLAPENIRPLESYTAEDGKPVLVFDEPDVDTMVEVVERARRAEVAGSFGFLAPEPAQLEAPRSRGKGETASAQTDNNIDTTGNKKGALDRLNKWYVRYPLGSVAVGAAMYAGAYLLVEENLSPVESVHTYVTTQNLFDGTEAIMRIFR